MPSAAPRVVRMDPRPTAVVAQTTTWAEFPTLWGRLLGEVGRELAGPCGEVYGHGRADPREQQTEVFWLLR